MIETWHSGRRSLLAALLIGTTAQAQIVLLRSNDPAGEVNPFIGTTNEGNEFPGAVLPFGMVAFSPEELPMPDHRFPTLTNGYEWHATRIKGFSLTHLMGGGCQGASGDIPVMPVTVPIDRSPEPASAQSYYSSAFGHDHEHASPGAYAVRMDNGVAVDLGATLRTGSARFAFPEGVPANLLIRPSASEVGSSDAHIEIDAKHRRVSGSVTSGNFCGGNSPVRQNSYYTLHFVAEFDRTFTLGGTWQDDQLHPGKASAGGGTGYGKVLPFGRGSGGWISFAPKAARVVTMRVGISYVDQDGAMANLRAENSDGTSLETVQKRGRGAWNAQLKRIAIQGGEQSDRTVFYTALYHSLIHPTLYSDVDGRYRGFDKAVYHVSRFQKEQYANFSGWDVYRSQVQLVTLLDPQVGSDFAQSLLNQADQNGGVWDRWTHITGATSVMNGDPSPPAVAAIRAFGGKDFDLKSAYASLLRAATVPTALDLRTDGPRNGFGQRPGLDQWLKLHYMAVGSPVWGPVATTLEYVAADFGVSELARQSGDAATARAFRQRAGWWRNLYNAKATEQDGYLQQRNADGSWPTFEPGTGDGFVEGSAAQYLWMVPFDPGGLFETMGGREAAIRRLDAYFKDDAGNWVVTNTEGGHNNKEKPGRLHPEMGNEPSISDPWLYNFVGQPWKTQAVVRTAQRQIWTNTPDGISGNDDLGQMSSWYVWAALGLYPLYPGRAELVIGSPLFPKATILRPRGKIIITANGAARDAPYVNALIVNRDAWTKSWLPASFIERAGTLTFELSSTPNPRWASSPGDVPPSYGPGSPID